ncbi:hypothetical protein [Solibacillus sp. FSL K6-1126]|uniref:hypothetical protein n=1 Tax=Solibacillus sp. FSL K6-1126 TaxID=2921463 RepID=UPI0030FD0237
MNNFRNPYVDPDTYQGKIHDYYKNPTTSNSIQFSLNNHQGFEQNETRHSQKNNQYEKTKKHPIYLNDRLGKRTDSKPVLFSPPKVDSVQKPLNENSKERLPFVISESKNREKDKEEVVSTLAKEFSLMLDDTSSKNEGFATLPESEFENDSFFNSSESLPISENKYGDEYSNDEDNKNVTEHKVLTKGDHYSNMLFDEFESGRHSLNENTSILEDFFSEILSESDELQEEKEIDESHEEMRGMNEEYVETYNDTTEDNFFTLFSKIDEPQEEEQDSTKIEADTEKLDGNTETPADKFYIMLLENDDELQEEQDANIIAEEIDGSNENTDTLADEFYTMLLENDDELQEESDGNMIAEEIDGSNENTDTLADKFYTMLLENDDELQEESDDNMIAEEIDAPNENTEKLADKFITILSESDELQKEKQNSSFTNFRETKSVEREDFSKHELQLCQKKPSIEKKRRNYYINKNNPYQIAGFNEVDGDQLLQKNTYFNDSVENKKKITVKMPVLLTELETDIDIIETIDLLLSLDNILKVEWSVQSLDCNVVLPSKTVFLKGEFIAEIAFSNKELENNIQTLKVTIPWKKAENIHWLTLPDTPFRKQEEFMFQAHHEHDPNYHYEAKQKFAESIQSQLKQVHFVWHQELNSTEKQLQVNGFAQLSIHFLQEQFVDLDCYSK